MPKRKTEKKNKDGRYHVEFSLLSLFCWSLGLFFLLVWIFVLGILVGRGFLPEGMKTLSELKAPIAKLQEMVTNKESDDLAHLKKMNKKPKFEFYDELSAKKEEVLKKGRTETKKQRPKATPPPDSSPILRETASSGKVNNRPDAPPLQETGDEYTLQLASLETEIQAIKMTEQLTGEGYPAYYYMVEINGKRYFRVRCGRFKDKKEALDFKTLLAEKKDIKGFITRADK